MKLETLVQRVSSFIATHPNERDCWQKAPALSGLLAWDMPEFRPVAKKWIDRAVATQKSDGNLSYGDWHTSSGGHIRSFTPLASETAAVGAPMLEWHERHPEARYLESARRQYVSLCNAPRTAEGGDETMETLAELFRSDPATVIRFVSRMNDVMSEFSQGGRS